MKVRLVALALSLSALLLVVASRAQEPSGPKPESISQVKDELATREQQLARQFGEFESQLLRLVQRLEKSDKREDRERGKVLRKILDESRNESIGVQFERMVSFLRESKLKNTGELKELTDRSDELANKLRRLIDMFRDDPRHKQAVEERKFLEKLVKDLERVILEQKQVQGLTENGKTDANELKNNQKQVTQKTQDLAKSIDKFTKGGDGGEPKDQKGGPKDGGKGKGEKGVAKGDGEKLAEVARADVKDGGGDPKADKGDAKGGESGAEGKAKDGQGAEAKAGGAKDGKKGSDGSQAKGSPDGKGPDGQAKDQGGKDGQAKGGDKSSPSQAKGGPKDGGPKDAPASAKGGKGSDGPKDSQAKSGGKSGSEGSPSSKGQAKAGDSSDGKSQAKADGQDSQGSQGSQSASKDGGGSPQAGGPQNPNQPPPKEELVTSKKKIQEAGYDQKSAEDNLQKKKAQVASKDQNSAIKKLEEAKEKLEKLLRQAREEELERMLAALQARCEKMLAMQMQVLAGTEQVYRAVETNLDKKANRVNQQDSLKLSDSEKEIIVEANKAIQMLEEEGSAVAFPEVFMQVREDMKHVQRRLEVTDVGEVTQTIERDIIASLKEMIEALKKARQELEQSKSPPMPGQPPPQADQKLLDQIAELKMIRSLQKRVNDRTLFYGRLYQGEQALDENLRSELQNLADRQERIFDITNRIAKGENR